MDLLATKQQETLDDILKIKINYKKDSESRKTQTYLHTRLNRLEYLWSKFSERDIEIQKQKENFPDHSYFSKNFFKEAEKQYEDIKDRLQLKLTNAPVESHTGEGACESNVIDSESVKLLRIQLEMIKLLERMLLSIKTESEKAQSTSFYEHKLSSIQTYWDKIVLNHTSMIANPDAIFQEYHSKNLFQKSEDLFEEVKILIGQKLNNLKRSDDDIKLPRMVLPTFEGNYQAWSSFRDIFLRLIHNNLKLCDAEKMQYLKTHLSKEASNLLQHLTISDANYETAWQLLNERYNNKRKICSSLVQTLISQPKLEQESASGIRKLHDTTKKCLHALSNLGIDTSNWSPIISHIILQKMDSDSHKLYEQNLDKPRELPTFDGLFQFLEMRFQSLETLQDSKKKDLQTRPLRPNKPQEYSRYKTYLTTASRPSKCSFCQQAHKIYKCGKFLALSVQERRQYIQKNKLCQNCLIHKEEEKCFSRHTCNICQRQHHSLIHLINEKPKPSVAQTPTCLAASTNDLPVLQKREQSILLATALVTARTFDGRPHLVRALIDQGSQTSFISAEVAQILSLPKLKTHAEVTGIGLAKSGTVRYKVILTLSPRFPSKYSVNIEALVLPQLTRLLPDKKIINYNEIQCWENIILADPTYDTPGPIDIILGADVFGSILCTGVKKEITGFIGQQTEFGWILSGPVKTNVTKKNEITSLVSYTNLDETLKKFWEIENAESPISESAIEDTQAEQHFIRTHNRHQDGSYTVRIPFKNSVSQLEDSRKIAIARLLQNERRFSKNQKLETDYKTFMQEYINLKHMIPSKTSSNDGYYLPHQAVLKEDSLTTKLRVVFDGSSKTNSGLSLNDTMIIGPKLQNDLTNIIIRWRKHRYVFTADIEKMYRQIKLHADDQKFQKILWRPSKYEQIKEYQLTTVTYGTASAPFLAIRALHQLAHDEKGKFPRASNTLLTDFYVDDLLTGTDSFLEAKLLQKELNDLMAAGGFKLRKWTSNQQSLLQTLPDDLKAKQLQDISDTDTIKTLGLQWSPSNDCFTFRTNFLSQDVTPTKRTILSDIAKLFDPVGFLAPVIIKAKILMQELWQEKVKWDDPLPINLTYKWNSLKNEFSTIPSIKIPRWIKYTSSCQSIQLHGFSDASEKAYAAVIYTRVETAQAGTIITMLASKTKVAPIKKDTSLPRLELCAAALLAQLFKRVKVALCINELDTYAWTDSKITLAWIHGEKKNWPIFVTNRVREIRKEIRPSAWKYVRSEDNPADCASRGITPLKLKSHPLWWTGPMWLALPNEKWPKCEEIEPPQPEPPVEVTTCMSSTHPIDVFTRFSDITRMTRVLSYCRRFIQGCRHSLRPEDNDLEIEEIHETLMQILKVVQHQHFPVEINAIKEAKEIPKSSKLISLTPFMDKDGILRLGGRLEYSYLPFSQKHPIILPHADHVTTLIIRDAHLKTLHGGNQATLAYLRRKYWVIHAKSSVKSVIHKCITCCRFRGKVARQQMGNLPTSRITRSRAFLNTGIDYAGPFHIRTSKGRGTKSYKGYIVVFVCLSTKAIHLDLVSDLTTEAFLAAYKRFTARRGMCSNIYSDCGTTFVGAKNELDKQFKIMVDKIHAKAAEKMVNYGTKWHFIPPASPHFGGLWEAGVKSTKYHLKRIAGDAHLTFEEFSTLLAQIEACLNSRPLCPLSNNPSELEVLTPGHFLVGTPLLTPPEHVDIEKPIHCLTRWKVIDKLRNDFWKAWSSEYLSRLQQRTKWHNVQENIKIGDIVLIKEDNHPPTHWPLGRIEDTHPGTDGLVRVVTIKTSKNTVKRPIHKLCKLPFASEELQPPHNNPLDQQNDDQSDSVNATHTTMIIPSKRKKKTPKVHPTNIPARPSAEEIRLTATQDRQRKRLKLSKVITPLLLLSCVLNTSASVIRPTQNEKHKRSTKAVDIEVFEHNPGIYLEHIANLHMINNVWDTIVYYDLNTYYQELTGFERCLTKLEDLCNKTTRYNYYCNSILRQLQHRVEKMHHNNFILHKRNGNHFVKDRHRRAPLEIIGSIQNTLFGVLDQRYADYIEGEVEKIRENENYLLSLAKNQTSITEVTVNVLKKTTKEIQHQFEVFDNHITSNLAAIKTELSDNAVAQTFTAMTTYTNIIMSNYENTQKELIELIVDAHNGKISPFLLSPPQLKGQIKYIREHISSTLIIPGEGSSEDLLILYKIVTVKARVTDSKVIFKLQIPLPDEKLFQLFKAYPVPTKHNKEYFYIEPSSQLLASSLHRDLYYPLSQTELTACIYTDSLGYLCRQTHPIYTTQSSFSRCEMELLNHKTPSSSSCKIKKAHPSQYWIQLQHPNSWIFVMNSETTINIVCGEEVIIKRLQGSGIIRLDQKCQVKHPTMSITAQRTFSNRQQFSFLPSANLSTFLSMSEVHTIKNESIPLIHLDTEPLDNIEFNQPKDLLPVLNNHHIHHYISTYIIAAIILAAATWYVYPRFRKYLNSKGRQNSNFEVPPVTPRPSTRIATISPPPRSTSAGPK